jgi:hypothetical protein
MEESRCGGLYGYAPPIMAIPTPGPRAPKSLNPRWSPPARSYVL